MHARTPKHKHTPAYTHASLQDGLQTPVFTTMHEHVITQTGTREHIQQARNEKERN